ncbi:MAG: FAD-dependent monooxygenase [Alphaproteobacteria bacterium]
MKILIVGAGLGGFGAAIALARHGFQVTLIEKAARLEDVGAGIQLSPNAMHVLAAYGLGQQVADVGFRPESGIIRDYASGRVVTNTPFAGVAERRYGQPYVHIHRADLVKILHDEALKVGVTVHLNTQLKSFSQEPDKCVISTVSGQELQGDALIGADGIGSSIQAGLFGHQKPRWTSQVAWRATVPVDRLPENCVKPSATVWRGPNKHLVTYLLKSGKLANIVAVEECDKQHAETWREEGDALQLQHAFDGWHADVEALLGAVTETHIWGLYDRAPFKSWGTGRVTLLGDACHPMLPFMAQGGAMALEDGYVLADCLKRVSDVSAALKLYERMRKPRTSMVQKRSAENSGLFHMHRGLQMPVNAAKLFIGGTFPTLTLKTLDPIYGIDVTTDHPK